MCNYFSTIERDYKRGSALDASALAIVSLPQGGIAKTKYSVNIHWLLASNRGSLQMTSHSHVKGKWENAEKKSQIEICRNVQCVNEKFMTNGRQNLSFRGVNLLSFLLILSERSENIPQIMLNVNETINLLFFHLFVILLTRASFALNTIKITLELELKKRWWDKFFFFLLRIYEN